MEDYYQSESMWDDFGRVSHPRLSASHYDQFMAPEHVDEEIVTTYRRSTSPHTDPWQQSRSFTPPPRALRDEWLTSPAGASSFAGSSVGPISPLGNSFYRSPTRRPASYYSPVAPVLYDTFDEEPEEMMLRSRSPGRRYRRRSPSLSRSRSRSRPRSRSRSFTPVRTFAGPPEGAPVYRPMRSPRAYYDSAPQEEVFEEHFTSVTTTHADGTSTTEYSHPPPRVYSSSPRMSGRPISPTYVERPSYSYGGRMSPVGEHIEEEVFEETTTTTYL